MKKQQIYKLLAGFFTISGLVLLIPNSYGVIDFVVQMSSVLMLVLAICFAEMDYKMEKDREWKVADEVQRFGIKQMQKEKRERERQIGNMILMVGVVIIIILAIVAFFL